MALGVAAWLHYLRGRSDDGSPLIVDDPMKDTLLPAARGRAATARSLCGAIFAIENVVPPALANSAQFRRRSLPRLSNWRLKAFVRL